MQRAEFPAAIPQSGDLPGSSSQTENTEPREDTEPRADTEDSETGLREVEPAALTGQQPHVPRLCCLNIRLLVAWIHPSSGTTGSMA